MTEQANAVRDVIAEYEEMCLRAELRARLMLEIRAWDEFFQAMNDYFASGPSKEYDA